jgi:hypothetical protein
MKVFLATVLAETSLKLVSKPSFDARRKGIILVPREGTRVERA